MSDQLHRSRNTQPSAEAYFVGMATEVFDAHFAARCAVRAPLALGNLVRYQASNWFAEVIYLPFDGPRYSPRVEVGVSPELFDDPRSNRVDVMHTVPIGDELRQYNLNWTYSNESQARQAFAKVRDEILTVYTDPFLADVSQLRIVLERRRDEIVQQWEGENQRHNQEIARIAADKAFRAGDYRAVIRHLSTIPAEALSPAECKKLDLAKKHAAT